MNMNYPKKQQRSSGNNEKLCREFVSVHNGAKNIIFGCISGKKPANFYIFYPLISASFFYLFSTLLFACRMHRQDVRAPNVTQSKKNPTRIYKCINKGFSFKMYTNYCYYVNSLRFVLHWLNY